jgi:hypothetical protein
MSRSIAGLAIACLGGSACLDVPDFADPSLIDRPRVLAIVAEPPEVNPGAPVQLSILVAHAEQYEVSWRACGAFDSFLGGGAQYGDEQGDEGCGGPLAVELGEGERAELPGEATQALWGSLALAEEILGAALPEDTIDRIREDVGLPFTVEATVRADDRLIRAVKRVLISARDMPHRNPPPPAFTLDGTPVSAVDGADFTCASAEGGAVPLDGDAEVELAPLVDGEDGAEPWLERYQVLDLRGELRSRTETAFYSWFASGGALREGVTKSPLRNEIWRTPAESSCHSLWLVVRDGHGGSSACALDVAVSGAQCE